jgi:hypothetical protein
MQNSFGGPNAATATPTGTLVIGVIVVLIVGFILYRLLTPQARDVTAMGPYTLQGVGADIPKNSEISLFDMTAFQPNAEAWYMRVLRTLRILGARNTGRAAMGNNFTFSGFYYMEDTNMERIPFKTGGEFSFKPTVQIIGVGKLTLDPIHQKARWTFTPHNSPETNVDIDNVAVAKWNQITLTVIGRTVDVYLNGVLAKSALLDNVPLVYPLGVMLNMAPDYTGQAGLFQAWPERLTVSEVARNYARNVDTRGKPLIPDSALKWGDVFKQIGDQFCSIGFCGFDLAAGPLQYIDYEFA